MDCSPVTTRGAILALYHELISLDKTIADFILASHKEHNRIWDQLIVLQSEGNSKRALLLLLPPLNNQLQIVQAFTARLETVQSNYRLEPTSAVSPISRQSYSSRVANLSPTYVPNFANYPQCPTGATPKLIFVLLETVKYWRTRITAITDLIYKYYRRRPSTQLQPIAETPENTVPVPPSATMLEGENRMQGEQQAPEADAGAGLAAARPVATPRLPFLDQIKIFENKPDYRINSFLNSVEDWATLIALEGVHKDKRMIQVAQFRLAHGIRDTVRNMPETTDPNISWLAFKNALLARYGKKNTSEQIRMTFYSAKQGASETAPEFADRLTALAQQLKRLVPVGPAQQYLQAQIDRDLLERFILGIRTQKALIRAHQPQTIQAALEFLHMIGADEAPGSEYSSTEPDRISVVKVKEDTEKAELIAALQGINQGFAEMKLAFDKYAQDRRQMPMDNRREDRYEVARGRSPPPPAPMRRGLGPSQGRFQPREPREYRRRDDRDRDRPHKQIGWYDDQARNQQSPQREYRNKGRQWQSGGHSSTRSPGYGRYSTRAPDSRSPGPSRRPDSWYRADRSDRKVQWGRPTYAHQDDDGNFPEPPWYRNNQQDHGRQAYRSSERHRQRSASPPPQRLAITYPEEKN